MRKAFPAGENLNPVRFSVFEEPAAGGLSFPMAGGMIKEAQMVFTALYSKPALGTVTPRPDPDILIGRVYL